MIFWFERFPLRIFSTAQTPPNPNKYVMTTRTTHRLFLISSHHNALCSTSNYTKHKKQKLPKNVPDPETFVVSSYRWQRSLSKEALNINNRETRQKKMSYPQRQQRQHADPICPLPTPWIQFLQHKRSPRNTQNRKHKNKLDNKFWYPTT
jgi:hypothetical protein